MIKLNLKKKGALCIAGLATIMACTMFSPEVRAAEESSMTQPSSAKIYSSMSENSDIIANLIVGNVFEVLEAQNDSSGGIWYRIRTDFGAEGYVKAREMDKLILDAQAMQLPTAEDTGGEEPAAEGEYDGVEPVPGEDNEGEAPVPGENNEGEESVPRENNEGEESASGEDNEGEAPVPEENNAEENNEGEEPAEDNDEAGDAVDEEAVSGAADGSDLIDGAGAGKVVDAQGAGSAMIGSEEFTVIERAETPKVHRHGRMDAVLIMIIAGGILCIIAIAALLKKIMKCVGTEV